MSDFKAGERIIYMHPHHLNSRSVTAVFKKGEFVRDVKENYRNMDRAPRAIVKIDGNKGVSTVPIHRIRKDETLTLASLRATVEELRKAYPKKSMLKEVRLLDHKYIKKLIPDPPKEDLPLVWGIPVVTDPEMAPNKIKLVYQNGREELYNV